MPKFIQSSLSVGLGALLYELVVRGPHAAKWHRVVIFILVSLPITWLIYRFKGKNSVSPA
jgi:hypothetical protein